MTCFLDANICLDLLDSKRPTADRSVAWYLQHKDNNTFWFSADFLTTFYYVMTEKRKISGKIVLKAIDALSSEIVPLYLVESDFILAKNSFFDGVFDDFEDLMMLESAARSGSESFITHDKRLLELGKYKTVSIDAPE